MHGWQKYHPQNNTHNWDFLFCLYVNVAPRPDRTGTVLHAEMLPEQSEKKNTESIITMATASNTCYARRIPIKGGGYRQGKYQASYLRIIGNTLRK